jgi:DNA (cytosine-5)-methyltransferase 1
VFDLVNVADYGVPQLRERVLFIGSRDGELVEIPKRTHGEAAIDGCLPWLSLRGALSDLVEDEPEHCGLGPKKLRYLRLIPAGGNWRDLPKRLHSGALGRAHVSWGGRSGFYRRLAWDRPAPALTTRPDSKATMLCHPDELRPLSIREYARLQQFPDAWVFAGGPAQRYVQIGNAVPVGLGRVIGESLRKTMRRRRKETAGVILCARPELLDQLSRRPTTVLNPPRMRRHKGVAAAKRWLGDHRRPSIWALVDNVKGSG